MMGCHRLPAGYRLTVRTRPSGIETSTEFFIPNHSLTAWLLHLNGAWTVVKVGGIGWDRRSLSSEYFKCVMFVVGRIVFWPLHYAQSLKWTGSVGIADPFLLNILNVRSLSRGPYFTYVRLRTFYMYCEYLYFTHTSRIQHKHT